MRKDGGLNNDEALDVAKDGQNNNIYCGYYGSTANIGGSILSNAGLSDIFVCKRNTNGGFLWVKQAGGASVDRAYAVATDNSSNVVVTGYISDVANFGTTQLQTTNNSQDAFVAKYNSTGTLQWAIRLGGDGSDYGFGIDTDASGNIYVTGQYSGVATFGPFSSTSTWDAANSVFTMDIFVCKISPVGDVLWLKTGAADEDNRGNDISVGPDGSVYMTGYFSGDITFDATYTNDIANVGFVLKMDTNGNELFLLKISSGYLSCEDIEATADLGFTVAGNYVGQMVVMETVPVSYTANYDNNIFLLRCDGAGHVVAFADDGSDNALALSAMNYDASGNAFVTGSFRCDFTEYNIELGGNLFYSAGFQDVFVAKFDGTLNRQWMRQYGGPGDSDAYGIAIGGTTERPVIAGGFESWFNIPFEFGQVGNNMTNTGVGDENSSLNACGFQNIGNYYGMQSAGGRDIYLCAPFNINAPLYDYVDYDDDLGASCPGLVDPFQILDVPENIVICATGEDDNVVPLIAYLGTEDDQQYGPQYEISWSSNVMCNNLLEAPVDQLSFCITESGWVWMTVERNDGCLSSETDSVYVEINESPPLSILNDTYGVISNSTLEEDEIDLCADADTLIASGYLPEYTGFWTNGVDTVYSDVVEVTENAEWTFVLQAANGCSTEQVVDVELYDTPASEQYPGELVLMYGGNILESDTLNICPNEMPFLAFINDTTDWYDLPDVAAYFLQSPATEYQFVAEDYQIYVDMTYQEGWTTYVAWLNYDLNGCPYTMDSLTVYLNVDDVSNFDIDLDGSQFICPGDSVYLAATSNVPTTYSFAGPGVVSTSADSIIYAALPGNYSVTGIHVTDAGCVQQLSDYHFITTTPTPIIVADPVEAVVCPGDSVALIAPDGLEYFWIGPDGSVEGTEQTFFAQTAGFYHCVHTNLEGCQMESNFIEVSEYSSAFITAGPLVYLCNDSQVELEVTTNAASNVTWLSPLTGSDLVQYVDEPGVYSVSVSLCDIIDTVSIEIFENPADPSFTIISPQYFCEGDSILLVPNDIFGVYNWQPGNSNDTILVITEPGTYTLSLTDTLGCVAQSEVFEISYYDLPEPVVSDVTVCPDAAATLTAASDFDVIWYDQEMNEAGSELTITTPSFNDPVSYYIVNVADACVSETVEVQVNLWPLMTVSLSTADLCPMSSVQFEISDIGITDVEWDFDDGTFSSEVEPTHVFLSDGTYNVVLSGVSSDGCPQTIDFPVVINPSPIAAFSFEPAEGCEPLAVEFINTSEGANDYQWSSDNGLLSGTTNLNFDFEAANCSPETHAVELVVISEFNCRDTVVHEVLVFPSSISDFELASTQTCYPEMVIEVEQLSSCTDVNQWLVNGDLQSGSFSPQLNATDIGENIITLQTNNEWQCADETSEVFTVHPQPEVDFEANVWNGCEGSTISFTNLADGAVAYSWDLGNGQTSDEMNITGYYPASGIYDVELIANSVFGCYDTLIMSDAIEIFEPPYAAFSMTPEEVDMYDPEFVFTDQSVGEVDQWFWDFGDGEEGFSEIVSHYYDELDAMYVALVVTDVNGCMDTAMRSIIINTELNVYVPNAFTPGDGDQINDYFGPVFSSEKLISDYHFTIFSRWGSIVFDSTDSQEKWTGGVKDGDYFVPDGVYVWQLIYRKSDAVDLTKVRGHVTIVR